MINGVELAKIPELGEDRERGEWGDRERGDHMIKDGGDI